MRLLRRSGADQTPAWKEMVAARQKLPAWRVKEAIIGTVTANDVTIISGETGSGKSTQSVEFILDHLYGKGLGKCVNTRHAASSYFGSWSGGSCVRGAVFRVGEEIGYAIRGESRRGPQTRVTFVTTGVSSGACKYPAAASKTSSPRLADVSHVVVDEVHERSLDTDFLLTLLREVMKARKEGLEVDPYECHARRGFVQELLCRGGVERRHGRDRGTDVPRRGLLPRRHCPHDWLPLRRMRAMTGALQGEAIGQD